jgi:hypothetical protein
MLDWTTLGTLIGIPILRNVGGWLEASLKDGEICSYEWAQLGETVLRVGIIGAGTYFGLNGMGIDVSALGASASAVVMDFILSAIKKKK